MHALWRLARGPFHAVDCGPRHRWERYDAHLAGCRDCGAAHQCSPNLLDSTCPLAHPDDGSVCCTITGYCIPNIRAGTFGPNEFVDTCVRPEEPKPHVQPDIYQEVLFTVTWFLTGAASTLCKEEEVTKTLQRCQALTVKILKNHKMGGDRRLPVLPCVLAETLHALPLRKSARATPLLCEHCAGHITRCLQNLNLAGAPVKRVNLVVGLLYLMKQGLTIQNVQWLPRVPCLHQCLPHETCLEKAFHLSMKLVCETENEIKLALRQRVKML